MTSASKSIYYFGFYLLLTGVLLTVVPNVLLQSMQIQETHEPWIHVLGVVVFNIGLFYVFMARANSTLFMMLAVYGRVLILLWFITFTIVGWAPVQLVLFGVIDFAGAVWTYASLKKA